MKSTSLVKCLFVIFLFTCQTHFAQIKIGAKAGYSVGKINDTSDNIYTENYTSSSGVDIGVLIEFPISDLFSLQTEFIYTERGGKRVGLQPIPTAALEDLGSVDQLNYLLSLQGKPPVTDTNPLYAEFSNTSELNYLEIPILGKLGWGDTWRFYVEAGPYMGFLLSSDQITSGESMIYTDGVTRDPLFVINPLHNPADPTTGPLWVPLPPQDFDAKTDTKDELSTWIVGFHAGSGLIRKIADKHELFLGFRGSWGYTTIQKDEVFGESHIGGLVFSLGYTFTL